MKTKDRLTTFKAEKFKIMNEHQDWVNRDKIKYCQCKKCKGFMALGWLFEQMKYSIEYCYECHDFRKFIVTDLTHINFVNGK